MSAEGSNENIETIFMQRYLVCYARSGIVENRGREIGLWQL